MNATPFFRIFISAIMIVCALLVAYMCTHPAGAAEPTVKDVPQLVIVVGYQDGKAIGGQVVGIADSLAGCQKGLEQMLPTLQSKPGVTLAAVCTPLPPAPAAVAHHQGEASI